MDWLEIAMLAHIQSRRLFLQSSLALAGVGLLSACDLLPPQARPSKKVPRIGFVGSGRPGGIGPGYVAFQQGMQELGHVERQTYTIEFRATEGRPERASELLAELVQQPVDVIYTSGTAVALAARQATSEIPIVIVATGDLVRLGLVPSLSRPSGNVTGVVTLAPQLSGKRLELLREAAPQISRVGLLAPADVLDPGLEVQEVRAAARTLGLPLEVAAVSHRDEFESAFAALASARVEGLLVAEDFLYGASRAPIVELAARHRLPAIYTLREFVDGGGLMSYGPNFINDAHRRGAAYVDKILNGAKPADLPIEQPTTFELVVNLKTAQTLGLAIPRSVLLQVSELIQ
jgi:putative ABC transport system substrate-binding protein